MCVTYDVHEHDARFSADRDDLYTPETVNPSYPSDTAECDMDAAMASAPVTLERTYSTPMHHNNPMEPHATTALWDASGRGHLTLWDSTQGVHSVKQTIGIVLGLERGTRIGRVRGSGALRCRPVPECRSGSSRGTR